MLGSGLSLCRPYGYCHSFWEFRCLSVLLGLKDTDPRSHYPSCGAYNLLSFFPLFHTAPSALGRGGGGDLCWHIVTRAQKIFVLSTLPSCEVSVSSHLLQDLLISYWWRQNKLLILIWIFKYISVNQDFEMFACRLPDWLYQVCIPTTIGWVFPCPHLDSTTCCHLVCWS